MILNNSPFHSQQSTFSSPSQQFLGIPLSLLPFTKNLPSIRHPNSCIVVWQQLICWLVLLTSLSMLPTGCPWFTNTGVFVDTQRTQSSYQAMHYCNFEAHVYHFSYRLGWMSSRWFILLSPLPYRPLVSHHNYTICSGNLSRLVHEDFPRSPSPPGSNTRSCSTTAEPTKCTEHGAIQKGSVRCDLGAVSFSCLLCSTIYSENCDLS